ncbi:MAG: cell envelope integrity protein CreD, partial [Rubrivivax sp.]
MASPALRTLPSFVTRRSAAMRFPMVGKALALSGVVVALVCGLNSVDGVVAERQQRQQEAEHSVADSLASRQTLIGPVLRRQCTERWLVEQGEGKDRKVLTEARDVSLNALPTRLDVKGSAAMEARYRGIFKIQGYDLKATVQAQWPAGAARPPAPRQVQGEVTCGAPFLMMAVSDGRGIRVARVEVAGRGLPVAAGTRHKAYARGFHAEVPEALLAQALAAELTLDLVGTQSLAMAPLGDHNVVELASDWPHPSFAGHFLPVERTVGDKGFQAQWQLSALATSAQQAFDAGVSACGLLERAGDRVSTDPQTGQSVRHEGVPSCVETFGVSFMDPVNPYVLSDRAIKYGLLFIVLTFVFVGLVEVMRRLRVHPIQYLLVGSALTVFFLLLVSLTEHVAFDVAYLVASAACTVLLAFYGTYVLQGLGRGVGFGACIGL